MDPVTSLLVLFVVVAALVVGLPMLAGRFVKVRS
jgi:hypothetical protein